MSTEVAFVCRVVTVRTLFCFGRFLVRYLLAGLPMLAIVVRPYTLLSTVTTVEKLVAIPSWLLWLACIVGDCHSFLSDVFVVGYSGLVKGLEKETRTS